MSDALDRADRVVALFSEAYFERSRYTTEEWSAAVRRLVPVRVEDVPPAKFPSVLRPLVFCDVFGVDADQARRVLLAAAKGPRRPDGEPEFPGWGRPDGMGRFGGSGPRLPGSIPRVWNLPARNPGFTGRDGLLVALRQALVSGSTRRSRRSKAWAGWARLSWPPSTRTGSPGPMAWPGGSTLSSPR